MFSLRQTVFWLSLLFWFVPLAAAQPPADPAYAQAVKLYESGDARGAVSALQAIVKQQPEHADAWHVLGMAQYRLGKLKEARKALEKAVALRPNYEAARANLAALLLVANDLKNAEREAREVIALNPQNAAAQYILGQVKLNHGDTQGALQAAAACLQANAEYANAYWLKTQALVGSYVERSKNQLVSAKLEDSQRKQRDADRVQSFKAAAESLEQYLQRKPQLKESAHWRGQLEALRAYAGLGNAADQAEAMSAATRPTILAREKAAYTEEARDHGVQGIIVIMVIFSADGTLKHPLVLRSLGYGLDERALRAASKIRFTPATRDGKPVSVIGSLEFSFNLY